MARHTHKGNEVIEYDYKGPFIVCAGCDLVKRYPHDKWVKCGSGKMR